MFLGAFRISSLTECIKTHSNIMIILYACPKCKGIFTFFYFRCLRYSRNFSRLSKWRSPDISRLFSLPSAPLFHPHLICSTYVIMALALQWHWHFRKRSLPLFPLSLHGSMQIMMQNLPLMPFCVIPSFSPVFCRHPVCFMVYLTIRLKYC